MGAKYRFCNKKSIYDEHELRLASIETSLAVLLRYNKGLFIVANQVNELQQRRKTTNK